MPIEHYYGRLSEEFGGALPSAIIDAQQRLPVGFLENLLEYRAYASAYYANQHDPAGHDKSEMRTLVQEIEFEIEGAELNGHHRRS